MTLSILTVPGYRGSDEHHWQTWLEQQSGQCTRVQTIDWHKPVLHHWSREIIRTLDSSPLPLLIVAHSYGCLASVVAAEQRPNKVAGLILAAPASPERFGLFGRRHNQQQPDIARYLPQRLHTHGVLIASRNDPWMDFRHAWAWSKRWGLTFVDAGHAGHINSESGHGAWPLIREITDAVHHSVMQCRRGKPAMLSYPVFASAAAQQQGPQAQHSRAPLH